jgi:nitrite reductase (NO-forming)
VQGKQDQEMTAATSSAARERALWPKDALRIGFGVIWLIDAILKWLPGFKDGYMDTIMGTRDGQPFWLRWWFDFWINLQHPAATFFWALVATVETLIAIALITGFARKTTYLAAIAFSLLIWSTAEGFGGPYTSGASDIGTAVIYVVVFAGLLALSYYTGPARYSADYYLEKKISWWWHLAEVRRPQAPEATLTPEAAAVPAEIPPGAVPRPAVPADDAPAGQSRAG